MKIERYSGTWVALEAWLEKRAADELLMLDSLTATHDQRQIAAVRRGLIREILDLAREGKPQ